MIAASQFPRLQIDHANSYASGSTIQSGGSTYYTSGTFPNDGALTSSGKALNSLWAMDTGIITESSGKIYSGRPDMTRPGGGSDRYFFRLQTRRKDALKQQVTWDYIGNAVGVHGWSVDGADAVDVWLRYQTQYNLYIIQFDRNDNKIIAKRKAPCDIWGGSGTSPLANKGVYYYLPTDSTSPGGAGATQPSYPASLGALAHDGTTSYSFKATCETLSTNTVRLRLYRGGTLAGSWTDTNNGINPVDNSQTMQNDFDNGYFSGVTGYQAGWYVPIQTAGGSGFRSDNIECWFDNVEMAEMP